MRRRQHRGNVILLIIILFLALVVIFCGYKILEATVFSQNDREEPGIVSKTITRDGIDYFPRQDIETLLVMGIDKIGPVEDSGSYNNDGEADTVMVLVFDKQDKTLSILNLNRDTMLEIPVLGVGGRQAGTIYGQLALAHTYGSGLEDSCMNTRNTVSDFLYGIDIDHYISMNMDAIAIVNDAVGGVTVHVEDDFSKVDPTITRGEMTLHGEQAMTFVRARHDVGEQLNLNRMDRQKEYMDNFLDSLKTQVDANTAFMTEIYNAVSEYMVTDCSLNVMTSMLDDYSDYTLKEIVIPEGKNVEGEEFMEFYVDEEQLDETILRLFYAPKK